DIYSTTRLRRPILLRLDDALSAGGATYSHPTISVEHVLPQNPALGSQWLKDFPDPMLRERWVHRLGNLLLLTHIKNSQASNWDFDKKKTGYFGSKVRIPTIAAGDSD
ncbi:MAG TPA: HNH endonuclease family protein, partial [Beijerinckiaceae bacterium]|nr:HNH endonuclease family protein [Beijerinckiaceae bacterium]